jgi:hypothetical protein
MVQHPIATMRTWNLACFKVSSTAHFVNSFFKYFLLSVQFVCVHSLVASSAGFHVLLEHAWGQVISAADANCVSCMHTDPGFGKVSSSVPNINLRSIK